MDIVKFTETVYTNSNKKGILTPDSNGYYTVVLGALNTYNSANEYYTSKGVVELFEGSSHFMRRIKNGALYSELGHPKKDPSMSMEAFYNRVITVEETNICAHIGEITLDFKFGEKHPELNNKELIAIIGKVKPAGAKANALEIAFNNPKQNAAFSIRGLTENKHNAGRVERRLTTIITFDHVVEPGITIADKIMSPSLEHKQNYEVKEVMDTIVDKQLLSLILKKNISNVSLESSNEMFRDILGTIRKDKSKNKLSQW